MPDAAPETAEDAVLTLLGRREPGATVCPSEVARALAAAGPGTAGDWRAMMSTVHAAVDRLVAVGRVRLSWKGQQLSQRAGPYRIGPAQPGLPSADAAD